MFFEDEKTDKKCSREGGKGLDENGGKSGENTKHSKNRELGLGSAVVVVVVGLEDPQFCRWHPQYVPKA